ncbi:MAG: UDP-4-amino-4,6-dideoxy-N-acetyl-beta-L-altrosamine N-acetyltransferase [Chitinivibrionia bacterium]|nr:UDP-4-amino-4,6-dideoxy-N-acetyl-beta-L-altrosamine N-acetyltransferase [Chitinivibrionia bacterium]
MVSLRKITESDTPLILKWRNSDFVMNNFVIREQFTEQGHKYWLENVIAKGKAVQYIILCDNIPIGSVYIRDIDNTHKKGEFGIFIGEQDFVGKGLSYLATIEILRIAFEELNLHRIYLRVFPDNIPAIKTYEKAGFVKEGILRDTVFVDGKFRDMLLMAVVNSKKKVRGS